MGNYLVCEDALQKTDAIVVLGGNSYERGMEAANVYVQFPGTTILCTGGNVPMQLLAFDTMMYEAQLTRMLLHKHHVPATSVVALTTAHSTRDEAFELLDYCRNEKINSLTIITSNFHLRRTRNTFEGIFKDAGIELRFHGAPAAAFKPDTWWQDEEGLITVNNEFVKLIYYWWKY
ncbi:MAG: YdcF family protein [Flavobacteriales bacterium]|nr:YdcF family protein [Flavobacteriales bacterium]